MALQDFTSSQTPKGDLGKEKPTDATTMWLREELWDYASSMEWTNDGMVSWFANYFWTDMQFGALMEEYGHMYQNTFVVLMNDHGMEAKGLLYEQGTRILNFMHYPKLFNVDAREGPHLMPADWIASNVDVAATVLELAQVPLPEGYQMDGVSYVQDMLHHLDPDWPNVEPQLNEDYEPHDTNQYQSIDVMNSHSIVTERQRHCRRPARRGPAVPQHVRPRAALRPLRRPEPEGERGHGPPHVVGRFEEMMRDYVDSICISETGVCFKPDAVRAVALVVAAGSRRKSSSWR